MSAADSPSETITFEKRQGIAYLTLNRPRALNAYNVKMRDEIWQALSAMRDDDELRVGVLAGAGERAFCAGADLSEFGTAPSRVIARRVRFERDVWGLWLGLPQPFIAALHGFVLGSGIEMALCCDLRVASDDAQFGLPEIGLGMIPAAGGTQTAPRVMGRAAALEFMLLGERVGAAEALRIGLVQRVVPRSELPPTVEAMAQRIAALEPSAVRAAKEAVRRGLDLRLDEGLALESRLAAMVRASRRE
jgi:enoyl-CoA hydratase/carnithine racemase